MRVAGRDTREIMVGYLPYGKNIVVSTVVLKTLALCA